MPQHTLETWFEKDHAARDSILEQARLCAALTKPWILPPLGHTGNDDLPENYQSIGSRGTTNLEGRMLLALFPPGMPWFLLDLDARIKADPNVDDRLKQQILAQLGQIEMLITSTLEATSIEGTGRVRRGFRSNKRETLSQIIITGDSLELLRPDYSLQNFRRDQYVTRRDTAKNVLYHLIREEVDPLSLEDPKWRERAGVGSDNDLADKSVADRLVDMYTLVEWQPLTKKWLIRQEVNKHDILDPPSEEPISPYFSTAFELVAGEHYGRGLCELNLGDLRSHQELRLKQLDFAAMASKFLMAIDQGSTVRETDLSKKSGKVIRARVQQGQITDVGVLKIDKLGDFSVVERVDDTIRKDLSKAFLLESEIQPQGDRVTALQVQRVALELEGALGGVYAPIADEQQLPLLRRTIWQLKKDRRIVADLSEGVELKALTGLAALGREVAASKLMNLLSVVGNLGPAATAKLDMGVIVDVLARYQSINEPGIIKSDEKMQQEMQQQMQQQMQQKAAATAIDTAGKVAQQNLFPPEPEGEAA